MIRRATGGAGSLALDARRSANPRADSRHRRNPRNIYLSLLLAFLTAVSGCFGPSNGNRPNGAACGGETIQDSATCEGGLCLPIVENAQGMRGVCSSDCFVDADCAPNETCRAVGVDTYCFRRCNTDNDCFDKFVCRLMDIGNPDKVCLVDPIP